LISKYLTLQLKESQTIEFKQLWRDDYLKQICAFANTHGGILYIGINDDGEVVGLNESKKLLEVIPNKVINYLGIVVDLNLHNKAGKEYLEIAVNPSSVPISNKGIYYVRSGSTTQELKGAELQHFILKKMGRTFDELPSESADLSDVDEGVVRKFFRKAIKANRLSSLADNDDLHHFFSNLKLITESGKLKNAAILLFGKDPLRFFSSVTFKIGRFGDSDHDLRFQDVIEGNIFEMPDKVIETLRAKYLVSPIRYEGLQRIEELEYPEDALREAVLNAVIHKDYTGVHIQLSVYDDKLILWNPGKLPDKITIDKLMQKHPSIPKNRNIADIFFKAGYIEAWGRGIDKIKQGFRDAGKPDPFFEELGDGFMITLYKGAITNETKKIAENVTENVTENVIENVIENVVENRHGLIILKIKQNNTITIDQLAAVFKITRRTIIRDIDRLKEEGRIKRIGPAKGGHWEVIN